MLLIPLYHLIDRTYLPHKKKLYQFQDQKNTIGINSRISGFYIEERVSKPIPSQLVIAKTYNIP